MKKSKGTQFYVEYVITDVAMKWQDDVFRLLTTGSVVRTRAGELRLFTNSLYSKELVKSLFLAFFKPCGIVHVSCIYPFVQGRCCRLCVFLKGWKRGPPH
jgi:hypothetical protein